MRFLNKKSKLLVLIGIGIIIVSLFLPWTSMGSEVQNFWGFDRFGMVSVSAAAISWFYAKKESYLIVLGLTIIVSAFSLINFINMAETLNISAPDINFSKQVVNRCFYLHLFGCLFTLITCIVLSVINYIKKKKMD